MDTKSKLENSVKDAMRSGDTVRKTTLRMVLAAIKQAEVDRQTKLDEAAMLSILQKEVKNRKESLEEAESANRGDIVDAVKQELAILDEFLPKAMEEEELRSLIEKTIADVGTDSPADMGKVMKAVMPQTAGRAAGDQVSKMVRELLQK